MQRPTISSNGARTEALDLQLPAGHHQFAPPAATHWPPTVTHWPPDERSYSGRPAVAQRSGLASLKQQPLGCQSLQPLCRAGRISLICRLRSTVGQSKQQSSRFINRARVAVSTSKLWPSASAMSSSNWNHSRRITRLGASIVAYRRIASLAPLLSLSLSHEPKGKFPYKAKRKKRKKGITPFGCRDPTRPCSKSPPVSLKTITLAVLALAVARPAEKKNTICARQSLGRDSGSGFPAVESITGWKKGEIREISRL